MGLEAERVPRAPEPGVRGFSKVSYRTMTLKREARRAFGIVAHASRFVSLTNRLDLRLVALQGQNTVAGGSGPGTIARSALDPERVELNGQWSSLRPLQGQTRSAGPSPGALPHKRSLNASTGQVVAIWVSFATKFRPGGPTGSSPRREPWDRAATPGYFSPGGAAVAPARDLSPLPGL